MVRLAVFWNNQMTQEVFFAGAWSHELISNPPFPKRGFGDEFLLRPKPFKHKKGWEDTKNRGVKCYVN